MLRIAVNIPEGRTRRIEVAMAKKATILDVSREDGMGRSAKRDRGAKKRNQVLYIK